MTIRSLREVSTTEWKGHKMPGRKPYHNSPYDDGGMPLGTTTADYDNTEEKRKNQVRDKYVPEPNLIDNDYVQKKLPKKITHEGLKKKDFNSAIVEGVNIPGYDLPVREVDMEDAGAVRELMVQEAEEKNFSEVQELPKVEKKETVDKIKQDILDKSDEDDFEKLVESQKPEPGKPKDK